ncbi:MAG: hypothetical protein HC897_15225 [Thermoanaerobaculia bacterium]|nr:hypothetical protein [Thermoanaerobaculia bacterium]
MHPFKIESFEQKHGACTFPPFRSLKPGECAEARRNIARALDLNPDADVDSILKNIFSLETGPATSIDEARFDLISELARAGANAASTVFLNWYRFDEIDELELADLSSILMEIWYPSADDIEIFDSSLSWIASVSHYGTFRLFFLRDAEEGKNQPNCAVLVK